MSRRLDAAWAGFLRRARGDSDVAGVVLTGSRGKGLVTPSSDYDVFLVVRDRALARARRRWGPGPPPADGAGARAARGAAGFECRVIGLARFRAYAAWGSRDAWDRYDFAHIRVPVDGLGGGLQRIVDEKGVIPRRHVRPFAREACDGFVNQVFRAMKCLARGDRAGARLESAAAVPWLLNTLFGAAGRTTPFNKYLAWELRRHPLRTAPWRPKRFMALMMGLLDGRSPAVLRAAFTGAERSLRRAGYGKVFDDWGRDHLDWMRSFDGKIPWGEARPAGPGVKSGDARARLADFP